MAKNEAVVEAPEKNWREGDFDVLPSAFIDGGEETDEFVVLGQIVEEMCQGTDTGDDDWANNYEIHLTSLISLPSTFL